MTVAQLGHCGPVPHRADDPRHQLFYLPDRHLVVVVESKTRDGWRCGIIAGHHDTYTYAGHVVLSAGELQQAQTSLTVDPDTDSDTFALLWQTRVRQHWLGGHIHTLARAMAESLRRPGTNIVEVDLDTARYLTTAARLRPGTLRLLLTRLADACMLTVQLLDSNVLGAYTLTLPEIPTGPRLDTSPATPQSSAPPVRASRRRSPASLCEEAPDE